MLAQPPQSRRSPHMSASCHAPSGSATTPGMMLRRHPHSAYEGAPIVFDDHKPPETS